VSLFFEELRSLRPQEPGRPGDKDFHRRR
jgi:hypothetical protein